MPSKNRLTRRHFLQLSAGLTATTWFGSRAAAAGAVRSQDDGEGSIVRFDNLPDRVWPGAELWTNPMEDWQVRGGRLECTNTVGGRNVHLLTHGMSDRREPFAMSVRCGVVEKGELGGVGFRFGIHDEVNDYRGNCFWGQGHDAGIANGQLMLGDKQQPIKGDTAMEELRIDLRVEPASGDRYRATLEVYDVAADRSLGSLINEFAQAQLLGNVALMNNFSQETRNGSRFWFNDWMLRGGKFDVFADRTFGPILWAMHTLSNTRGEDGVEMKMSVQMPPLSEADRRTVELDLDLGDAKEQLVEDIDPDACTARFRMTGWDATKPVPYRVRWTQVYRDGTEKEHAYEGTIRPEPLDRPLKLAGMTCQQHMGFPYGPVAENVSKIDPDLLYFSGYQLYEENGHFGFIRRPADRAILCYLRKWYMFGWVFGDVMRDRPTLCVPDDHDVFQANIFGEGGEKMPDGSHVAATGGYIQPVRMVNVVHTTQCGHHPRFYDPEPAKRDISVWYGDMVYGRVSFAIISDRQFKTGPEQTGRPKPRPDWIPAGVDVETLDDPSFVLLGERQEQFLSEWVEDWRGCDMKVLLSETVFANVNTHHARRDNYLQADLDSGAWPQTARNRAIEICRKAFPVHINGDQHLATLVQYGVENFQDSFWAFCTPAVSVGYQRWWLPDEVEGRELMGGRPPHGLPNTGNYLCGLDHPTHVWAVANPEGSQHRNRYTRAQLKASGFGLLHVDRDARTYAFDCFRFDAESLEQPEAAQYAGWPKTVEQLDNYGRARFGTLPEVQAPAGTSDPVVRVRKRNGELVYALRVKGNRFTPFVFEDGIYNVEVGDPDADSWDTVRDLKPEKA